MLSIEQKSNETKNHQLLIIFPLILIFLLGGVFSVFAYQASANIKTDKALNGVYIEDNDVSGKTKQEICELLQEKYVLSDKTKFKLGDTSFLLSKIDARYDYAGIAETAVNFGKQGNIWDITMSYINLKIDKVVLPVSITANEKDIANVVEDIATINNDFYELDAKKKELKIKYAKIKDIVDKEDTIKTIQDALYNNKLTSSIAYIKDAAKHSDELYAILATKPKNAEYRRVSLKKIEIKKEKYGISLDKKRFQTELKRSLDFTIPVELTKPSITKADLEKQLFNTKMASYTTYFNSGQYNRSSNIRLAAGNINGIILLPGEDFAYNRIVGERKASNGFKLAHAYAAGQVVEAIGGGICQTSTTLYNAVLKADLKVVERHNHQFTVSYVPLGQDATVSYGGPDFKFQNNTKYPVKVNLTVSGASITATLTGSTKPPVLSISNSTISVKSAPVQSQPNPNKSSTKTVVTQAGHTGYTVDSYKVYKSGKRVFLHRSVYNSQARIILTPQAKPTTAKPKPDKPKATPTPVPIIPPPTDEI